MFYGLSKFFKNILPKRLFYRALLIVAVPVIVLQLVITIVFFDSLWIKTNKGMTKALVNEINTFIEVRFRNKDSLKWSVNIHRVCFAFDYYFIKNTKLIWKKHREGEKPKTKQSRWINVSMIIIFRERLWKKTKLWYER